MATVKTYLSVDMSDPSISYGDVISYDSTHITISDGIDSGTYYGSFTYSAVGLNGGTVTGYDSYHNGVLALTVRGDDLNALTFNAYLEEGDANGAYAYALHGNDTFSGSPFADWIRGYAGADILNGGGGADYLQGDGGNDKLKGGAGNDKMVWSNGDSISGGAGFDSLKLASGNLNLVPLTHKVLDTEQVDMRGGGHSVFTVNRADVLDMSGTTNHIRVLGDSVDTVHISGSFSTGADSGSFKTYNLGGGALLLIESDVHVVLI